MNELKIQTQISQIAQMECERHERIYADEFASFNLKNNCLKLIRFIKPSKLSQLAKPTKLATIFFIFQFSIFNCQFSFSQEIWYPDSFIQTQGRLSKDGAIGLTSWGLMNVGFSGYMMTQTTGQEKNFHTMNLIWGGIDLAVGIPTFIRSYKIYKGKIQLKMDSYNPKRYMKIYAVNGWLDLAYIGAGFIVKSRASHSTDPEMMRGFGNSIILQGGFLFTFDNVMYLLHRKLLKNHIRNQVK